MKNITCGADIGSRTIKIVLYCEGEIINFNVSDTTARPKQKAENMFYTLLKDSNLTEANLTRIISTGYGRDQFTIAHKKITEISCHAKGVSYFFPQAKTIIDIGGQDSKVIRIDNGSVFDFAMNDKCAAGTGRFLESAEKIIEVQHEKIEELLNDADEVCQVSSMCVVFAESEIIGLLASGKRPANILAGVLESLAKRTSGLLSKTGFEAPIVFTGGVAQNNAMIKTMEKVLETKLLIPKHPSITGALGAAIIASGQP